MKAPPANQSFSVGQASGLPVAGVSAAAISPFPTPSEKAQLSGQRPNPRQRPDPPTTIEAERQTV